MFINQLYKPSKFNEKKIQKETFSFNNQDFQQYKIDILL